MIEQFNNNAPQQTLRKVELETGANARVASGAFLTTNLTPRIVRHYERLVRETKGLVEWHLVHNPGNGAEPKTFRFSRPAAELMPTRYARMTRLGGLAPGNVDLVLVPLALDLPHTHTWIVEFDADFSGDWADFFRIFADNDADLLATSLVPFPQLNDWDFYEGQSAPPDVAPAEQWRMFPPLLRMSKRFAAAYVEEIQDPRWGGHHEFTMPTIARYRGLKVEDIGGSGPLCPPQRRGTLYWNTPTQARCTPGSFVWRPGWERHFHERPSLFEWPNHLYHPIKHKPRSALAEKVADMRDTLARLRQRLTGR